MLTMCDIPGNTFFRPWNNVNARESAAQHLNNNNENTRLNVTNVKEEKSNERLSSSASGEENDDTAAWIENIERVKSATNGQEHPATCYGVIERESSGVHGKEKEMATAWKDNVDRESSVVHGKENVPAKKRSVNVINVTRRRSGKSERPPEVYSPASSAASGNSLDPFHFFVAHTEEVVVPFPSSEDISFPTMSSWPSSSSSFPANCLQHVSLANTFPVLNASSTVPTATCMSATTGQPFYYGYPGVLPTDRLHPLTIEHAAELIHRQEETAKQMKKLRPKKFRCEHCDVAFSNNGQLKGHIRIHTGERPFTCDAEGCGKSFTRNEELTRHKRIHTGHRPYACSVCGKCFGRKDHLKKHTKTHENRDPYRMSAAALGMYAVGHGLPPSFLPYMYPI